MNEHVLIRDDSSLPPPMLTTFYSNKKGYTFVYPSPCVLIVLCRNQGDQSIVGIIPLSRFSLKGFEDHPAVGLPSVWIVTAVRVFVRFDRIALAHADRVETPRINALAHQITGNCLGPLLRERLVIGIGAA